ncbi:MAG TPA: hypothetical protein VMB91_00970 [Solirubrobacteraceae bacterium]|nr:hypothetical protein [Solirubrobacteraceae bacterium]
MPQAEQLTIKQTPTGYWSVQRGATHLAGAATRKGAEAERELIKRISRHSDDRRSERREPVHTG